MSMTDAEIDLDEWLSENETIDVTATDASAAASFEPVPKPPMQYGSATTR